MPPSVSQQLHSPFAQSPRGGPPTFSYAAITTPRPVVMDLFGRAAPNRSGSLLLTTPCVHV